MISTVNGLNINIYIRNISIDTWNMNLDVLNIDCLNRKIDIYLDRYSKWPLFREWLDIP